jgi:creatinine amidohydrolase
LKISDMNWMQVEEYVKHDDRAVLPIGSTEQHAYLSLSVDAILAERLAVEVAEPSGVPVFPTLSYGITPYFTAYPGTISLKVSTMLALVADVLDSMKRSGFRRVLIINGHGGNNPVLAFAQEWMAANPEMIVLFHNWWNAPRTWQRVQEVDPVCGHASWMENFPWTRLANVAMPEAAKKRLDSDRIRAMNPAAARAFLGDGNYGGLYRRPDEDMLSIWQIAIEETRALITGGWS